MTKPSTTISIDPPRQKSLKSTWLYKFINGTYMMYAGLLWVFTFLLLLPLFFIADIFKWDKFGLMINHYWAHVFFPLIGVPLDIEYRTKLDKSKNYIFCANHFSFLDIAIMPFLPIPVQFVGKRSIGKVPLFGYMFKRFHITVDRSSNKKKYEAYNKSLAALKRGFSLGIFPEGGIKSKAIPTMGPFKEGPFRMSVETGVEIVPVSFADNWRMFPDDKSFRFNRSRCRAVVHPPIDPSQFSLDTLKDFQEKTYTIIQTDIDRLNSVKSK